MLREEGGTTVKEIARAKNGLTCALSCFGSLACDPDAFTAVARVSGERKLASLGTCAWPGMFLTAYDAV